MHRSSTITFGILCLFLSAFLTTLTTEARAHFPWLIVDDHDRPTLFFGEDLTDRTYHLPAGLAEFPLHQLTAAGKKHSIPLQPVSQEHLVGLQAAEPIQTDGCLYGSQTYGVYHGSRLVYYVEHLAGDDASEWASPPANMELRATITPHADGLRATVLWKEGPLADCEVALLGADGGEQATATTGADGTVTFAGDKIAPGLNALRVGHTDKNDSGTHAGETFQGTSRYLTATFDWARPANSLATAGKPSVKPGDLRSAPPRDVVVVPSELPELPLELTSFGAAIAQGKLFVYGGHMGEAHSYSTSEQSDQLLVLNLDQPSEWNESVSGPRLQGLAMVAHAESLVRIGGFTAMNAKGEEHDLQSQATVSRFDIAENRWTDLTPLPEPRSSHAAALLGDRLYVMGGWAMAGDKETKWHSTSWYADLNEQPLQWKPIASPPFQRRALSVAAHDGKIYAIGGMDHENGPSTRVDIYDPGTDRWEQGPSLSGDSMTGFGCWAQSFANELYVSTVSGTIQRLSRDGKQWELATEYEPGRFFHCMLPVDEDSMVMVGGANMSIGRFTDLDLVKLQSK